MIKTQSFNDFSSFSFEEKRDYNFIFQQLKTLKENGGDASLMVREDRHYSDKMELITFRDFIMKNIKDSESFFKALMKEGILPGLCDFEWNSNSGYIQEKKGYGLSWMKKNYNEFTSMIVESVQKLLKELPDDLSLIQSYNEFDYSGELRTRSNPHPLYIIANEINEEEIYKLIFESKPNIKNEWMESGKFDEPKFLQVIGAHYNDVKNPALGILFYKYGIGTEYFHETSNSDKLHDLIRNAAFNSDLDFLKDVLPKVDLTIMEKNKHSYELCLGKAQTSEVANILLDHNAIIAQKVEGNHGVYSTDVVFSEDLKTPEVLDTILKRTPSYLNQVKEYPAAFYKMMQDKPFEFTKLLVEKYEFPLENYDMLFLAWKKEREGDIEKYKWLLKNGADTRECDSFCGAIVSARDTGLKHLRQLNKEGIVVAKSPDMIFHIFNSSPTKIFINYYDKLTSSDLEKFTKQGFPAWWGAKNQTDYSFVFSKITHHDQTAQDGQTLLFYVLERELKQSRLGGPKEIINIQLKKLKQKDPEYKLDLSYTDKQGNNFLHNFFTIKRHVKDTIDPDLLLSLTDNSKQSPFDFLHKENKEGISPIEILLTQDNKMNHTYSRIMKIVFEEGSQHLDFKKLIQNKSIGDYFLEQFSNDKEMSSRISAAILEKSLMQKDSLTTKKMKI